MVAMKYVQQILQNKALLWWFGALFGVSVVCDLTLYLATPYDAGTNFLYHTNSLFLHVSELILFLGAGVSLYSQRFQKPEAVTKHIFFCLLAVASLTALIQIGWSVEALAAHLYGLRLLFYAPLLWNLLRTPFFEGMRAAIFPALCFQAALMIFQIGMGRSLGLWFLEEPMLTSSMPDAATFVIGGNEFLRGYGTFQHPNIAASIFFLTSFLYRDGTWKSLCLLGFVLFTGSKVLILLSALFALLQLSTRFRSFDYRRVTYSSMLAFLFLVLLLFQTETVQDRLLYMEQAFAVFLDAPFGVGFWGYERHLVALGSAPWHLQPVHNAFLLLLIEGGVLFFITFLAGMGVLLRKYSATLIRSPLAMFLLISVCLMAFVDHYLLRSLSSYFMLLCALFSLREYWKS